MQNMMRRHQMNWVFEIVKLALLVLSGYLTYGFLTRFLGDFWFRILALVLYEGGLLFWHYVHHYKVETPRQHMFSRNMERLSLLAVGTAAGYQLLTLVSHSFGDVLPSWTHTVIEIATVVIFMVQLWAFTKWEKLSNYYQAVEQHYNRELTGQHRAIVSAALASTDSVKVVESNENSGALPSPSEADGEASTTGDSAAQNTLQKVVKMLPASTRRVRLEDRVLALEALAAAHPELSVKELALQTGIGESTVRQWKKGK